MGGSSVGQAARLPLDYGYPRHGGKRAACPTARSPLVGQAARLPVRVASGPLALRGWHDYNPPVVTNPRTYREACLMRRFLLSLILFAAFCLAAAAGSGWRELFNGKDLEGWQDSKGNAPGAGWVAEDGALVLKKKGGGYLWTRDRFGDFVLDLEVKTTGNSGVFIRTDNPKDPVQTGIEIQVDNPADRPDKHSFGAIYDLVAPKSNPAKKGEWTRLTITADKNLLRVEMNGELISEMDLDRWTEAGK